MRLGRAALAGVLLGALSTALGPACDFADCDCPTCEVPTDVRLEAGAYRARYGFATVGGWRPDAGEPAVDQPYALELDADRTRVTERYTRAGQEVVTVYEVLARERITAQ